MAERKTQRVAVFLTPEQLEWLKTKKNVSETVRALITEAMNLDRLKESVRATRPASAKAGRQPKARSRKGGSSRG